MAAEENGRRPCPVSARKAAISASSIVPVSHASALSMQSGSLSLITAAKGDSCPCTRRLVTKCSRRTHELPLYTICSNLSRRRVPVGAAKKKKERLTLWPPSGDGECTTLLPRNSTSLLDTPASSCSSLTATSMAVSNLLFPLFKSNFPEGISIFGGVSLAPVLYRRVSSSSASCLKRQPRDES